MFQLTPLQPFLVGLQLLPILVARHGVGGGGRGGVGWGPWLPSLCFCLFYWSICSGLPRRPMECHKHDMVATVQVPKYSMLLLNHLKSFVAQANSAEQMLVGQASKTGGSPSCVLSRLQEDSLLKRPGIIYDVKAHSSLNSLLEKKVALHHNF